MATTAAPYGLRPVKRIDGLPYAGSVRTYLIDPAGVVNNIFNGSVVQRTAAGYIELADGSGADLTANNFGGSSIGALGVFLGCEYVNAQGQLIHSQYYPTGTVAPTGTAIKAFVVDDPFVLFQAQFDGATGQADMFQNTHFAAAQHATTSGSTLTGNSTIALTASTTANAAGFKVIEWVSPAADTYADVLVMFNPGAHAFRIDAGV